MHAHEMDLQQLSLMVLRLMDADLVLPEEGDALLAEIEALGRAQEETSGPLLRMLTALVQSGRLDASIGEQAQEIVRKVLSGKRAHAQNSIIRRRCPMSLSIYALDEEEGTAIWFLNTLAVIKATAGQTGGAFSLVAQFAPVGSGSPYHVHRFDDESFYITEGELEFISEGTRFVKGPGSFVFLPKNIPHGFRVVGTVPARFLILANPGGFEGFITEAGESATTRSLPEPSAPDIPKLVALAAKYQIEILGPLPD